MSPAAQDVQFVCTLLAVGEGESFDRETSTECRISTFWLHGSNQFF